MRRGPTVGQHLFQTQVVGMQAEKKVADVAPRQFRQLGFDLVKHRIRFTGAKLTACLDRPLARAVFELIQLPNPFQHLMCFTWRAIHCIEKLPPRVRPIGNFDDTRPDVNKRRVVARRRSTS